MPNNNYWYEMGHIDSAEHWLNEGYTEDELCIRCGEPSDRLLEGVCKDCLAKFYDEHEGEMFLFFYIFPPNEWDDTRCKKPIAELWAEAERERFANDFGETRKYLKAYALEDAWCLAEFMTERGMI